VSWLESSGAGRSREGSGCGAQAEESQGVATVTTGDPRIRYAAAVLRACENDDLPLMRALFTGAVAEVFTLRGLLPREVEFELGKVLAPKYRSGASLLVLSREIGRSTQYVAKVLQLVGVTIRPACRPAQTSPPVDLVELRQRYENGSSIASLAHRIHYSRESIRKFLRAAGTEARSGSPRQPVGFSPDLDSDGPGSVPTSSP